MIAVTFNDLLIRRNLARYRFLRCLHQFIFLDFPLVEGGRLEFASFLEGRDDRLILPANLVGETTELTELTTWPQSEDLERRGHDDALLLVIRGRDTLVHLQALHRVLAAVQLVRQHASDGPPEDLAWSAEMIRTTSGVRVHVLLQEIQILEFVSVEVARNVDAFTSYDNNTLTL